MLYNRKSQISVFMIIGVVMVVLFGGAYYASQAVQKVKLQAQADALVLQALQTTPLRQFVTTCLEKESKDALKIIGAQGGNIYLDQGGLIERDFGKQPYLFLGDSYIDYGLLNQEYGFFMPPPLYPATAWNPGFMFMSNLDIWPYFGDNNIKPLCDPEGENAPGKSIVLCKRYGAFSIQEQVRDYITKKLPVCANFTDISESFNFTPGQPEVQVTFSENDIVIDAKYPVNVRVGDTETVLSLADFSTVVHVRLKKLYEFVDELLGNDAYDARFDLLNDYRKFGAIDGEMTVSSVTAVSGGGTEVSASVGAEETVSAEEITLYSGLWDPFITVNKTIPFINLQSPGCRSGPFRDSIVNVKDAASLIKGDAFTFTFAVQNRNPVLEWVHRTAANNQFDIVAVEGDNLTVNPQGYDPDEEKDLVYSYSGWKEDYDEVFCLNYGGSECAGLRAGCEACTHDILCKTNVTQFREKCIRKIERLDIFGFGPRNWTLSPVYINSKKSASVRNMTSLDIGPHFFRIIINDSDSCSDWQDILVLVTDIAKPDASASGSGFKGFNGTFASVEDPYVLNASFSTLIFGSMEYRWFDELEAWSSITTDPVNYIKLPDGDYTINDIDTKVFTQTGEHEIDLLANGQPSTFNVSVFKCLPYRGKDYGPELARTDASVPAVFDRPYPYNGTKKVDDKTVGGDPFEAPHSCCYGYEIWEDDSFASLRAKVAEQGWTEELVKEYNYKKGIVSELFPIDATKPSRPLAEGAWGTYMGEDSPCYTPAPEYGSLFELLPSNLDLLKTEFKMSEGSELKITIDIGGKKYSGSNPIALLEQAFIEKKPDLLKNSNDVWQRRFVRYCSAERGNICTGDGELFIELAPQPLDTDGAWNLLKSDFTGSSIERCVGVKSLSDGKNYKVVYYQPGDTFEMNTSNQLSYPTRYYTLYPEPTGYCKEEVCVDSSGREGAAPKDKNYPFASKMRCNGGGGCTEIMPDAECNFQSCGSGELCSGLPKEYISGDGKTFADIMSSKDSGNLPNYAFASSELKQKEICTEKNTINKCDNACQTKDTGLFAKIDGSNCNADDVCVVKKTPGLGIMLGYSGAARKVNLASASSLPELAGSVGCDATGHYVNCFPYGFNSYDNTCKVEAQTKADCFTEIKDTSDAVIFKGGYDGTKCVVCEPNKALTANEPYDVLNSPYQTGRCSKHCGLSSDDTKCDGITPKHLVECSASSCVEKEEYALIPTSGEWCDESCGYHKIVPAVVEQICAGFKIVFSGGEKCLTCENIPIYSGTVHRVHYLTVLGSSLICSGTSDDCAGFKLFTHDGITQYNLYAKDNTNKIILTCEGFKLESYP